MSLFCTSDYVTCRNCKICTANEMCRCSSCNWEHKIWKSFSLKVTHTAATVECLFVVIRCMALNSIHQSRIGFTAWVQAIGWILKHMDGIDRSSPLHLCGLGFDRPRVPIRFPSTPRIGLSNLKAVCDIPSRVKHWRCNCPRIVQSLHNHATEQPNCWTFWPEGHWQVYRMLHQALLHCS